MEACAELYIAHVGGLIGELGELGCGCDGRLGLFCFSGPELSDVEGAFLRNV